MAEGPETLDAVVLADAALADPAERQIVLRDVHDRAVDGDVARRRAVKHLASVRFVAAEVVERKWSGQCVHVGDGVNRYCRSRKSADWGRRSPRAQSSARR